MIIDGYCTLGVDREFNLVADDLLRKMDTAKVDKAVIAPLPRQMAVDNHTGNEAMLKAAASHADRFIPTCAINPWRSEAAMEDIRQAASRGARMLVLFPAVQGFTFGDDLAYPAIETASNLRMPIYVHTGNYEHGTPAQLGLAAARYPNAVFIMGHGGSTDYKADAIHVTLAHPNVYMETSLMRPAGAATAIRNSGKNKVIMGSAAPLNDFVFEWNEMRTLLPANKTPGFYGDTLAKLIDGVQS